MANPFATFALPDVAAAAAAADAGGASAPDVGVPGLGSVPPPGHHRRASTYARLFAPALPGSDNDFERCLGPAPGYVRGTLRRWWTLKSVLARRALRIVEGPGAVPPPGYDPDDLAAIGAEGDAMPVDGVDAYAPGPVAAEDGGVPLPPPPPPPPLPLRDAYGFQGGVAGAARCAVEGLAADLAGCGGAVPTPEEVRLCLERARPERLMIAVC